MALSRVLLVLGILTVDFLQLSFEVLPISPLKADSEELVPLQPQNLHAKAVSPNEIEVIWDAPEDDVKIVAYTLYYSDSERHQKGQINITPPTTKYKLTELIPSTIYHIQLVARCARGECARSIMVQAKTEEFTLITNAPEHMKVMEDAIVSFFCKASGHPPPAFQWEREGKTINNFKNKRYDIFYMPQGTVLRIHNAKAKDGTYFTCVAKNEHGEARANATLTVYEMEENVQGYPRFVEHPTLRNIEKNQTATLVCLAQADNRDPPTIYWLKDNIPLEMDETLPNGENRILQSEDGTLTIKHIQERDHGKYECVAQNEVGVAYSSAVLLYVKVRRVLPHFHIEPDDIYHIFRNTSISIPCSAVGSPMPVVKWRHGYQEINPNEAPRYGINQLNLTGVLESANYTCVAESELGSIEKDIRIVVQAPGSAPRNVRARLQTTDTILIDWDEPEIPNGIIQGYKVFYTTNPDLPIVLWMNQEVTGDTRSATISGLIPNSTYTICVLALSSMGQGQLSVPVQVSRSHGAPGSAPRNVRSRPRSTQTILIDWDEPEIPNGVIQGYKVFYTTNPDLPIVLWMNLEVTGDNKMATISGLIPNSTYAICVLAFSSMGQGPLSVPVQVMTRQGVPLQPRNLHAKAVSPNEIEVIWDAPEDVDKIVTYTLYYNDSEKHQNGQINIAPPTTKYKLTELIPSTIYHIQLAARSARGEGARSIMVQAKTEEFTPPQAVSGRPLSPDSILVEWRPPPNEAQNGVILGYRVYYVPTEEGPPDSEAESVEVNGNDATLIKLDTWTEYKIWVLAFSNAGDSPQSPPIFVKTHESVPNEPKRVEVTAVNSTTIHVNWRPPRAKERNGIILGYYVYYTQLDENNQPLRNTEKIEDTNDGNRNEVVITGLRPDTRYQVSVAGYTRRGDGVRSKPRTINTKGAVPSEPRKLTAELIQPKPPLAQVSWFKPEETNGEIQGYKLFWGPKGGVYHQVNLKATQNMFLTPPLGFGRVYEFRVMAKNDVDFGDMAVADLIIPANGAPGSPPRNVRARPLSTQTILIDWDEPEIPNGVIQGYKVFYTINPDLPIVLWMNQVATGDNRMATISGLIPISSYTICVLAFSSMGQGPLSVPVKVMTRERTPLAAPRNVRARQQNKQPILIYWDEPEISNGVIQGYKVFYTTNPDLPFVLWMNLEVTGDKRMANVGGLVPNSTYAICVMAFSRIENGKISVPACTRIN